MHLPQHTYLQLDRFTSICQFVLLLINIPISFVSAVILFPIWLFYALNVWIIPAWSCLWLFLATRNFQEKKGIWDALKSWLHQVHWNISHQKHTYERERPQGGSPVELEEKYEKVVLQLCVDVSWKRRLGSGLLTTLWFEYWYKLKRVAWFSGCWPYWYELKRMTWISGYWPYYDLDIDINWKGWLDFRAIYHIVVWILI